MNRVFWCWFGAAFFLCIAIEPALADNCGSLRDCYLTAKNAAVVAAALTTLAMLFSLGLDLAPVVGDIKGIIEAVIGRDLITGQKLPVWQRVLGAVPVLGRLGDLGKIVNAIGDGASAAGRAATAAKTAAAAGAASKVVAATQEAIKATSAVADATNAVAKAGRMGAAEAIRVTEAANDAARAAEQARDAARSVGAAEDTIKASQNAADGARKAAQAANPAGDAVKSVGAVEGTAKATEAAAQVGGLQSTKGSSSRAFRGDDFPYSRLNAKGIRKSHINDIGDLVPANPDGVFKGRKVTVADHILGSYRRGRKANSPFTSFSLNKGKAAAWSKQQGNIIEVDLNRLQKAIDAGDVSGIRIVHQKEILEVLAKEPANNFRTRAIAFTTRENEILIEGVVPASFIYTNF